MHWIIRSIFAIAISLIMLFTIGCAGVQGAEYSVADRAVSQNKEQKQKSDKGEKKEKKREVDKSGRSKGAEAAFRVATREALESLREGSDKEFQKNWILAHELAKSMGAGQYEVGRSKKMQGESKKIKKELEEVKEQNQELKKKLTQKEKENSQLKAQKTNKKQKGENEEVQELKEKLKKERQELARTEQKNRKLEKKNRSLRELLAPKEQDEKQKGVASSVSATERDQEVTEHTDQDRGKSQKKQEATDSSEPQARLEVKGAHRYTQDIHTIKRLKSKAQGLEGATEYLATKVQKLQNRPEKRAGPPWWIWLGILALGASLLIFLLSTKSWWEVRKRKLDRIESENESLAEENSQLRNEIAEYEMEQWEDVKTEALEENDADQVVVHPVFGNEEELIRPG